MRSSTGPVTSHWSRLSSSPRLRAASPPRCAATALDGVLRAPLPASSSFVSASDGGELIDGEVWGRGAVDMLNLTASMAVVMRNLAIDVAFKLRHRNLTEM